MLSKLAAGSTPTRTKAFRANAKRATVSAALRPGAPSAEHLSDAGAPPVVRFSELETAVPPDACPPTMVFIAGGDFWMGSPRERRVRDEQPRFSTKVASFCLDTYEVTAASYAQCVEHDPANQEQRAAQAEEIVHAAQSGHWGQL